MSLRQCATIHSVFPKAGAKVRQVFELCKYFYEKSVFFLQKGLENGLFAFALPEKSRPLERLFSFCYFLDKVSSCLILASLQVRNRFQICSLSCTWSLL